nr:PH domain-containing protein [Clostridia bacterium]
MTYIWQDRKRTFLGLPLSFTKYMLSEDRLFVEKGFLNSELNEEQLYRIRDVKVTRSLGQRLFHLGTVTVFSAGDETVLESIKDPIEVKEEIVRLVEEARRKHGIRASEMLMNAPDIACDHEEDGIPDPPAGE